jgi:hypothetical protein
LAKIAMSGLKNAASSIVPTFITKTPGAPGVVVPDGSAAARAEVAGDAIFNVGALE